MNLHTQGTTAYRILELLNAGGEAADAVLAYFAPYCSCDPAGWIRTKLQQGDAQITALIADIIKRPVVAEPALAPTRPWAGWLVGMACVGTVNTGTFADGAGSTYTAPVPISPNTCT